jgi:hypothetical protein
MADEHQFISGTSQRVYCSTNRSPGAKNKWQRQATLDYPISLCFTVHLNPESPYYQPIQHQPSIDRKNWLLDRLQESLLSAPRLYFELKSVSSFNRHCSEGYGYLDLGLDKRVAGTANYPLFVPFWRPLNGPRDELRTFFLGSAPEYETPPFLFDTTLLKANIDSLLISDDAVYPAQQQQTIILNKFGSRVKSSTGRMHCQLSIGYQLRMEQQSSQTLIINRPSSGANITTTSTTAALMIEKRRRQRSMGSTGISSKPI